MDQVVVEVVQASKDMSKDMQKLFRKVLAPQMDKVLHLKEEALGVNLSFIKQDLTFMFYCEKNDKLGVTFRRQFSTPEDVRVDDEEVMSKVKELNYLSRDYVQNFLKKNGQGITFEKIRHCIVCKKIDDSCKVCACGCIRYCSKECQAKDWPVHKKVCSRGK